MTLIQKIPGVSIVHKAAVHGRAANRGYRVGHLKIESWYFDFAHVPGEQIEALLHNPTSTRVVKIQGKVVVSVDRLEGSQKSSLVGFLTQEQARTLRDQLNALDL